MSAIQVEAEGLTVKFGRFTAVDHVSFRVPAGEIFGFLGANGAGKTTTIRVLCGLLTPTAGRVKVAGRDPARGLSAVKERVGYMSQKFTLYPDLSVGENLRFAAALRKIPEGLFQERSKDLLGLIGEGLPLGTLVKDLPGGLKQQVSLATALLHDPAVVFLDEPTAGVTPAARARFWSLIRDVASRGKTVFVTTHYMDEAEQCARIALMRDGRIIALDSPAGLKRRSFHSPLLELTPRAGAGNTWVRDLQKSGALESLSPHGLRYHAVVRDARAWAAARRRLKGAFSARRIEPSLEDVFIRLVEGKK